MELVWIGSSRADLKSMPADIRKRIGFALRLIEHGGRPANSKTLSGFNSAKVNEIRENDNSGTYRAVYMIEYMDRIFVLHVFQKKSTHGIATPRKDMALIKQRIKEVRGFLEEEKRGRKP